MKRLPVEDLEHIYQNTQDIWESFRGKSIFLTGGTGFFGKWLLESFIYANEKLVLNARITVLSRNPSLFLDKYPFYIEHSEIIFLSGDVVDFQFPDTKFDYVIHAATDTDSESQYKSPLYLSQSIIQGTKRVLELSSLNKVEGFLFTSSGAVYGKQPINIEKVKETDLFYIDLTDPKNTYTESKRIAELYTTIYHKQLGIPNKIARCFAFVGPYLSLDKHFAIGNFIKDAIAGIDISINGNGQTIRSYMYASDLIIWLWKILIFGESNSPYNVGSDEAVTLIDVAKNIQNIQKNININITNKLNESGLNNIYVPSISKANEIGLKINVSMAEAIIKTINFYKYDT